MARDAKASWRTITGETYGSIKAGAWSAPKPEFNANRLRLASEELAAIVAQIEERTLAIGDMQGIAHHAGDSKRHDRWSSRAREKVRRHRSQAAERPTIWPNGRRKWITRPRRSGSALPNEQNYNCPSCGAALCHDRITGNLVAFTPPQTVNAESAERLLEYERARDLLARSVENDKRDLNDAGCAAKMLGEIGDAQEAPAPAPEEIAAALTMVKALKEGRAALQQEVESLNKQKLQAEQADQRTVAARIHRDDVVPNGRRSECAGTGSGFRARCLPAH